MQTVRRNLAVRISRDRSGLAPHRCEDLVGETDARAARGIPLAAMMVFDNVGIVFVESIEEGRSVFRKPFEELRTDGEVSRPDQTCTI